jgi:hypothetical protein
LEKDKILNDPVKQMTCNDYILIQDKIGQNTDCPSFFGLYDYCQISAGASFDCAVLLAENYNDVCINWFQFHFITGLEECIMPKGKKQLDFVMSMI